MTDGPSWRDQGAVTISAQVCVRIALGLESSNFASSVSTPLGFLLVAAPALGYHLLILRREMAPDIESAAEVDAVVEAPAPSAQVARELVIGGPAGPDFDAFRSSIASRLRAGYSIQVRSGGDPVWLRCPARLGRDVALLAHEEPMQLAFALRAADADDLVAHAELRVGANR